MAAVKPTYLSVGNAVTLSGLSTLASGSTVFSSAIDNTANLDADHLLSGTFTTASSGVSATGTVNVVVTGSFDGGATYATAVANCKLAGVVTANAAGTAYQLDGVSVASLYGGQLPPLYKVGVTNSTGAALASGGVFYCREGTTVA